VPGGAAMKWIRVVALEFLWVILVVAFFVLCSIGFVLLNPRANPGLIELLLQDLFMSAPVNSLQFSLFIWILANYTIRFFATWALNRIMTRYY